MTDTPPCPLCDAPAHDGTICHQCAQNLTKTLHAVPDTMTELDTTLSRQHTTTPTSRHPTTPTSTIHTYEASQLLGLTPDDVETTAAQYGEPQRPGWWPAPTIATIADTLGLPHVAAIIRHPQLTAAEQPSPVDTAALTAKTLLALAVHHWSRVLARDHGLTPPTTGHAPWLADHSTLLRQAPWAATAHCEITRAHTYAVQAIDNPPPTVTVGPCPHCRTSLTTHPGALTVTCPTCRAGIDVAEARDTRLREAEDRTLTARQIAAALTTGSRTVTQATIRGWVLRDERAHTRGGPPGFRHVGYDLKGRPLYRLGDALDRWAQAQRA